MTGRRLSIAGVPVGEEITDLRACRVDDTPPSRDYVRGIPICGGSDSGDAVVGGLCEPHETLVPELSLLKHAG